MSNTNDNGRIGGRPTGRPSVYRRIRKRTPEELAETPPVRTKPVRFTGCGTVGFGRWKPGDPVGVETEPSEAATEALLDWALVSWGRRRVVEEVWDFTAKPECRCRRPVKFHDRDGIVNCVRCRGVIE
jgi:hypothetical protein